MKSAVSHEETRVRDGEVENFVKKLANARG